MFIISFALVIGRWQTLVKRKKMLCPFLIGILIFSTAILTLSAETSLPKLLVNPPTYTASALDEVFTIDVNIANVTDLSAFELNLSYNTTLLDATNCTILVAYTSCYPIDPETHEWTPINDTLGQIYLGVVLEFLLTGDYALIRITFKAVHEESASCTLDLYDTELTDMYGSPMDHEVEDGYIHGNLTLEGLPYPGLVALEVDDPSNTPIVVRTVQTSPTPPPEEVTIVQIYTCDFEGTPKTSFERDPGSIFEYFYVNATVKNNSTEEKDVTIIANVFDANFVPVGIGITEIRPLGPGKTASPNIQVYIPEWVSLGNAMVFVSVLTHLPRNGTPYCREKSAAFQIIDSFGATVLEDQNSGNNLALIGILTETVGNYSLTFRLRTYNVQGGNYTVYASSRYLQKQLIVTTTFEVIIRGDLNGDGKVSIADVKIMDLVYSGIDTDPEHIKRADLNGDDKVTIADVKILDLIYSGLIT